MHKIIGQIISEKKRAIAESKAALSEEDIIKEAESLDRILMRPFKNSIKGKESLSLIAEIKQASPSKGIIRKDFDPAEIAKIYESHDIAAISVLTEENFFKGSLKDLRDVRQAVKLPVLRKDFIVDTYQIYESYLAGADCVLLIVKIVTASELARLFHLARSLGMAALVEVHNEQELEAALKIKAEIIGINNRNLDDFTVDNNVVLDLASDIPKEKVVVAESGIVSSDDIEVLRTEGFDAVLIGEAFLKEKDIDSAINKIWNR